MAKTIVVGFDDQEPAARALERAAEEAKERGCKLLVIAVAEMPLNPSSPRNYGTLSDGPAETVFPEPPDITKAFEHARELLATHGVSAEYAWEPGEPASILVGAAKARKAELIVIGDHHHGFFTKLFGASITPDVQREAGCDVLVVP